MSKNSPSIAIVDYGMGNLRSVAQALMHAAPEANVKISSNAAEIKAADKVVLPGQGAMPDCMSHLQESGLLDVVLEASRTKPMLGVCVGEQMLFESRQRSQVRILSGAPDFINKNIDLEFNKTRSMLILGRFRH